MSAAPAWAQSLNTSANGTYGRVTLVSGFEPDPAAAEVTAGGSLDASVAAGEQCMGFIAQRPDYTLRYTAEDLPLFVSATSDVDTTLVVRTPSGAYVCDDDASEGVNPGIHLPNPETGRYQIWVGTFAADGGTPQAQLYISEIGFGAAPGQNRPDVSLEPAYGAVALASGFTPDPQLVDVQAGGELDASLMGIPGCVGFIAQAPDYRVNFTAGTAGLPLVFSVASEADTTLVVNLPNGQWICDDDGGNGALNPAITLAQPESGQYDIWVGTYASGPLQASSLNISELYAQ
ncbi:MAG: hypothetical protein AB7O04_10835 [Hyphomonadaceae bacterium]